MLAGCDEENRSQDKSFLIMHAHLKGKMKDARLMKIGDAAGELGYEPPKLFVVLDAAICRDAIAEPFHDELRDSEAEVATRRAIVMHSHDVLRDRARF